MPRNGVWDHLYEVTFSCAAGSTVDAAAKQAYELMKDTDLKIFVIHNDRRYRVSLEWAPQEEKPGHA
jgi:hypothetical protein